MTQQYIPVDADAEASVITGLLTAPEVFLDVTSVLEPEDFAITQHQDIYQAILACDAAGRPIDVITVTDALRKAKRLSRVGGADAVEAFAARSGESTNILAHAQIVADKAKLRRLYSAGRGIATAATAPAAEAGDVLSEAESQIFAIGQEKSRG